MALSNSSFISSTQVKPKPSTQNECIDELVDLLRNRFRNQSGIIYTTSVKDCDQLASELRQRKCLVASYHASLEPADRTEVHLGWRSNKYQVLYRFPAGFNPTVLLFYLLFFFSCELG